MIHNEAWCGIIRIFTWVMMIITMVMVMIMDGHDVDDKRLHLQARVLHARVDVEYTIRGGLSESG